MRLEGGVNVDHELTEDGQGATLLPIFGIGGGPRCSLAMGRWDERDGLKVAI